MPWYGCHRPDWFRPAPKNNPVAIKCLPIPALPSEPSVEPDLPRNDAAVQTSCLQRRRSLQLGRQPTSSFAIILERSERLGPGDKRIFVSVAFNPIF